MIASKGHTIIAMGNEAYDMFEKSPTDITVTSPMTFGMIANLELQEIVLYSMIERSIISWDLAQQCILLFLWI